MLVVGLTGGIASGKSTVSARLRTLGAAVIDADRLAREAVQPGEPALEEIRSAFGDEVIAPDGTLDRARLAAIVFASEERRRVLEGIVHPRVRKRMRRELEELRRADQPPEVVVLDVPLLFETGMCLELVDCVIVVYVPVAVQEERLMRRSGMSVSEARLRIRAQMPIDEKVGRADYVIDNSGPLEETMKQVDRLWEELRERSCGSP